MTENNLWEIELLVAMRTSTREFRNHEKGKCQQVSKMGSEHMYSKSDLEKVNIPLIFVCKYISLQ